jgi:hypothetical protein
MKIFKDARTETMRGAGIVVWGNWQFSEKDNSVNSVILAV